MVRHMKARWRRKDGTVHDGTPTHLTSSCQHNNWCPYCRRNRTYSSVHRAPIEEH